LNTWGFQGLAPDRLVPLGFSFSFLLLRFLFFLRSKRKENEETVNIILHAGKMLKQFQHDAFSVVNQLIKKLHKKYYRSIDNSAKLT